MPRTPDRTRLSSDEATEFRAFVREMRERMQITNSDLAIQADSTEERIASILRDSRAPGQPNALLGAKALEILSALRRLAQSKPDRQLVDRYAEKASTKGEWLRRYRARLPAVQIRDGDIERFAEACADEAIAAGVPRSRRALIIGAISRFIRRERSEMAIAYFAAGTEHAKSEIRMDLSAGIPILRVPYNAEIAEKARKRRK